MPIGVALLKNIDPTVFRLVVGVVLAGFCTVMLFSSRLPKITFGGRLADGGIGFVGGIMGGIAGLSGAVPTLWTSFRGWKKDVQRARLPVVQSRHARDYPDALCPCRPDRREGRR